MVLPDNKKRIYMLVDADLVEKIDRVTVLDKRRSRIATIIKLLEVGADKMLADLEPAQR